MSDAPRPGVVVDTMVISRLFDERPNPVADQYRVLIGRAPVVLAFPHCDGASFRCDTGWVG